MGYLYAYACLVLFTAKAVTIILLPLSPLHSVACVSSSVIQAVCRPHQGPA